MKSVVVMVPVGFVGGVCGWGLWVGFVGGVCGGPSNTPMPNQLCENSCLDRVGTGSNTSMSFLLF